eukprot:TRINITY_DN1744_c0_g1_i1.p1 TRINITY_DN1744_c0_g1~~TRINITY_DN1744_c0_g1_i1.p1  ORF type:complete len:464 (+),score=70.79 TRINITY_DN1744_c0_g1_i1:1212-2603(+)
MMTTSKHDPPTRSFPPALSPVPVLLLFAMRLLKYGLGLLLLCLLAAGTGTHSCGGPCDASSDCGDQQCSRCVAVNVTGSYPEHKGYCVRGLPEGSLCEVDTDCYVIDNLQCVEENGVKACKKADDQKKQAIGFLCAGIAVLCFGSNFVPVKKFETGDGMFFQWVLCIAIWFTGLVVNFIRGTPTFHPYAMLGGILWASGNVMVVPCVKCIGLGLGMCVWGSVCMLAGWASGRFGLFGVNSNVPPHEALNYLGVVACLAATVIFMFIKPTSSHSEDDDLTVNSRLVSLEEKPWDQRLTEGQRKFFGLLLAVVSGFLYGINFDPPQHLMDNHDDLGLNHVAFYSPKGLDYVFSHFCGIITASTFYFLVYCIYNKNRPLVYPQAILPGFVSGVMWAIAQTMWFIANTNMSLAVSFPLISVGPGVVSMVWGVFAFHEIQGPRNFAFLGAAFFTTVLGVTLVTLSKGT